MPIDTSLPAVQESTSSKDSAVHLRSGIAILSIAAILSLSLEIEVFEHLDSFSRFMTSGEIVFDAGIALIGCLAVALAWWFTVLLLFKVLSLTSWTKAHASSAAWSLWLGVPATYVSFGVVKAVIILFSLPWNFRLTAWLLLGSTLMVGSVAALFAADLVKLQTFCHSRLAPVGWLHLILGFATLAAASVNGVHVFHDFARPVRSVTASNLPDVYLITLDALRAEDMSLYGYRLPTTPDLEKFSEHSSTFDYFVANTNFTTSATASIETGELPWSHGIFQLWGFLRHHNSENLAALLRQRGYYTAMISSNELASPVQHRTLDSYDAVEIPKPFGAYAIWPYTYLVGANSQGTLNVSLVGHLAMLACYLDVLISGDRYPYPAETVFERARTLVESHTSAQPLFVWTHILPPHDPYWPPASFRRRFLPTEKMSSHSDPTNFSIHRLPPGVDAAQQRARYDEMIAYADHAVGDYLGWLARTGRLDRSIVIISADHGESFEHDWFTHTGPYLYSGLIHIPLLIHLPGQEQGNRISYPAQQADLLPTILDLVGEPTPAWTDGVSLKPLLRGNLLSKRYIFSMNLEPNRVFDPITKGTIAVMDDEFKYVDYLQFHRESLYRYRSDTIEEHDLISSEPEVAGRMRKVLMEKLNAVNGQVASQIRNPDNNFSR